MLEYIDPFIYRIEYANEAIVLSTEAYETLAFRFGLELIKRVNNWRYNNKKEVRLFNNELGLRDLCNNKPINIHRWTPFLIELLKKDGHERFSTLFIDLRVFNITDLIKGVVPDEYDEGSREFVIFIPNLVIQRLLKKDYFGNHQKVKKLLKCCDGRWDNSERFFSDFYPVGGDPYNP